jgi:hypothetical protein
MVMSKNQQRLMNIATEGLSKGVVRDDKQLIAWDCIQDCSMENCPISNKCLYIERSNPKCALQIEYLQSFTDMIFRTYRYVDEADMFRIGMNLVPLYSSLCRMKIVEKSIGSLTYEDAKGRVIIHPIYKEMRETMKVIQSLWREMGFMSMGAPGLPDPTFANGKTGFGDPNHYQTISQGADNKRDVIR